QAGDRGRWERMSGGSRRGAGLAHRAAACPTARQHDQARAGKSRMPGVADDPGALRERNAREEAARCRLPDQPSHLSVSCLLLHLHLRPQQSRRNLVCADSLSVGGQYQGVSMNNPNEQKLGQQQGGQGGQHGGHGGQQGGQQGGQGGQQGGGGQQKPGQQSQQPGQGGQQKPGQGGQR